MSLVFFYSIISLVWVQQIVKCGYIRTVRKKLMYDLFIILSLKSLMHIYVVLQNKFLDILIKSKNRLN